MILLQHTSSAPSLANFVMPPKKTSAVTREDTVNSESALRDSRQKRNHSNRDAQDEAPAVVSTPSFNIEALDSESLRKYRKVMHLQLPADRTNAGEKSTEAPRRYERVQKSEALISVVKRHWNTTQCKETEVITSFMYSIKNQDKTFKLRFVESTRN
ncbi:protein of unknown function [Taphrina deformans PYCC 5710]|uniref:Histone deacetylase complex subunit SAP30 Sin3 binding domain-containing protein n=1 Tax=Taphrina deformans (strain PYCC 5710 / ATCC 11124 / CBS 356.35 / IMI 108563 / JCM 9778 / NBRC 8474) TaxID=1097556 RepID=R4X6V6_TAPDE|nr:protein of unknown function [Taphrina deformans PYCC 5710]|eukprot:CCG80951.1 protein of unknown function [Taphrina deformans PYCC 5710]